jgi:hypothetical protein
MFNEAGEAAGTKVFDVAMIAGAVFLLLGTLWTAAAPDITVAQASPAANEQVVVIAHPRHVS